MILSIERKTHKMVIEGQDIEQVRNFRYRGTTVENEDRQDKEISDRVSNKLERCSMS